MVSKTIKMTIFCQPPGKLIHNPPIWHHELKLFLANSCRHSGARSLENLLPDSPRHRVFHSSHSQTKRWRGISNAACRGVDGSKCSTPLNVTAAVVQREAVIHPLNAPVLQHSKSFLCLCYKVKVNRMWSVARLGDRIRNRKDWQ